MLTKKVEARNSGQGKGKLLAAVKKTEIIFTYVKVTEYFYTRRY
jgi:hypothetical protein